MPDGLDCHRGMQPSFTTRALPPPMPSAVSVAPPPRRVAVIDSDSGFLQVLGKRVSAMGWEHRVLEGPVQPDALIAMRLNAVVVDLALLGPDSWSWLEHTSGALPSLGIVVCTGPSSVAQRVRGLRIGADDWLTKPCHPEEVIARIEAVVRRHRRASGGQRPGQSWPGSSRYAATSSRPSSRVAPWI